MNLKQLVSLTRVEIRNFIREPMGGLLMLTPATMFWAFAVAYGDFPSPCGFRMVDLHVPSFIVTCIFTIGIMNIPYTIVNYKATKVFKRFKGTPLSPGYILFTQAMISFAIVLIGTLILIAVAIIGFDIEFYFDILNFVLAFALSNAAFFSLGFILAGLLRTIRGVEAITSFLYFPLLFLSGIFIPLEAFPQWLQNAAEFNPATHCVDILTAAWLGDSLDVYTREIIILCTITVVCTLIAIKTFRWE